MTVSGVLYPAMPVTIGIGAAVVWLFIGAIFGPHRARAAAILTNWFRSVATAFADAGRWCHARAGDCIRAIEAVFNRMVRLLPDDRAEQQPGDAPAAPAVGAAVERPAHEQGPLIVVIATFALLCFICLNGYLLYEITPNLFSLSPKMIREGYGKYIAILVPSAILLGEVAGGILVKSERRRRLAGAVGASTLVGWLVFASCYGIEVLAGLRRAFAFLVTASPFSGAATRITFDSAATAALWVVLASGVPWMIFGLSMVVEPVLSRITGLGRFFRLLFGAVGSVFATTVAALAIAAVTVGCSCAFVVLGVVGILAHLLAAIVEYVVYAAVVLTLAALIAVPHIIVAWGATKFRRRRAIATVTPLHHRRRSGGGPTAAILFAGSLGAFTGGNAGCTTGAAPTNGAFVFPLEYERNLRPAPDPIVYDDVADSDLPSFIGERHKVVRVVRPQIHVCLADLSASVRSTGMRMAILEQCAQVVTEMTAYMQGPETTGIVLPIVQVGVTSDVAMERIAGTLVPMRCAVNPPLAPLPSRSTVADKKFEEFTAAYDAALAQCNADVTPAYDAAVQQRTVEHDAFFRRVVQRFRGEARQRTDLFGSLATVAEIVRREREQVGGRLAVTVTIISDLEDDANGCTLAARQVVLCPENVIARARAFCTMDDVACTAHQVRQATLADPRSGDFTAAKRTREKREEAWADLWLRSVGFRDISLFAATPRERTSSPSDAATSPRGENGSAAPLAAAEPPAAPAEPACVGTLRSSLAGMTIRTLTDDGWLTYGHALDACGPSQQPWAALGAGTRDEFVKQYVVPFINGDYARASLFQRTEQQKLRSIRSAWGFGE